jgi:hypothetical protein
VLKSAIGDDFEVIQSYTDDEHFRRMLLRCRECGQLYLYEMREETDWENGNDPIFRKYVPVASAEEADGLAQSSLEGRVPCLRRDWPADREQPEAFWVRAGA